MTQSIRVPNFFIVGAPKCGTTALASYLEAHPDIYMAPKEPHHFGSDLVFRRDRRYRELDSYLGLYSNVKEASAGDASVWYLYSKRAAEEIWNFNKEARIIAMIRNPVDFLYSEYYQLRKHGDENITVFEEAIGAESDRKNGERLPDTTAPGPVQALFYLETAQFSEQLLRYLEIFGREQVLVIVYDDFASNPRAVYHEVLNFLSVPEVFLPSFEVVNANKRIRSEAFHRFLHQDAQALRLFWRSTLPSSVRGRALRIARRLNTVERPRPEMREDTRSRLQSVFKAEVRKLSALLDRDLMPWVETPSGKLALPVEYGT